jgi:hypothetical protein
MLDKLAEEVARDFSGRIAVGEDLTEINLGTALPATGIDLVALLE